MEEAKESVTEEAMLDAAKATSERYLAVQERFPKTARVLLYEHQFRRDIGIADQVAAFNLIVSADFPEAEQNSRSMIAAILAGKREDCTPEGTMSAIEEIGRRMAKDDPRSLYSNVLRIIAEYQVSFDIKAGPPFDPAVALYFERMLNLSEARTELIKAGALKLD